MRITEEYVCIRLLSTEKKCVQVGKLPVTALGEPTPWKRDQPGNAVENNSLCELYGAVSE